MTTPISLLKSPETFHFILIWGSILLVYFPLYFFAILRGICSLLFPIFLIMFHYSLTPNPFHHHNKPILKEGHVFILRNNGISGLEISRKVSEIKLLWPTGLARWLCIQLQWPLLKQCHINSQTDDFESSLDMAISFTSLPWCTN